jgi:2-C-methyl-D-erythritol 2,4-cyclodiphosphate synthase
MERTMIRIGQGIDVHAFDDRRPMVLGGVRISETGGLAGHSDADVVLHAITDALLGAAGAGDIGQYFPSDDERWRNADSSRFIEEALRVVRERDAAILNVDVTIVGEKPKIAPHREAIQESVAGLLGLTAGQVNIKATSTDHLGFLGRAEGLCALAAVLIQSPDQTAI